MPGRDFPQQFIFASGRLWTDSFHGSGCAIRLKSEDSVLIRELASEQHAGHTRFSRLYSVSNDAGIDTQRRFPYTGTGVFETLVALPTGPRKK